MEQKHSFAMNCWRNHAGAGCSKSLRLCALCVVVLVLAPIAAILGQDDAAEDKADGRSAAARGAEVRRAFGHGPAADDTPKFRAGEVLVAFRPNVAVARATAVCSALGAKSIKVFPRIGVQQWKLPPGMAVADAVRTLSTDPSVKFAEANYVLRALDTIPSDPYFDQPDPLFGETLWGLHNTGQGGGTPDADIDAPAAWDLTTGSYQVVVGVVDTGVEYAFHEDLYRNIWINQGEIPPGLLSLLTDTDADGLITVSDLNHPANAGQVSDLNGTGYIDVDDLLRDPAWTDGIDTDGNGFVDDLVGWTFNFNANDPFDVHGHGTHVSGTIGASGNNGLGVVGVNWNVQIMPLQFLDAGGSGFTSDAIAAINYATMMRNNGVNIVLTSNSWGGGGFSQALRDAIQASGQAGLLFVAAAGNDGANADLNPMYPAAFDLDNIVSVAATDRNDQLASFSNYGATSVDLGAPGVEILSTYPFSGIDYVPFNGTSMATPQVSGVAALAWSMNPGASYQTIRDAIFAGVDPAPSLQGITVTGGRLNAFNAVNTGPPAPGITVTPTFGLETSEAGGQASFDVVLATQPTANVTIGLSSSDTSEGSVSPTSLIFSATNWNTSQTVTVTGVDDAILDGDVAYTIVTAPATSPDPNYNGLDPADVSVTNLDNEAPPVADFVGSPTSGTAPLTVDFTDLSANSPTSWSWNFGDTGTSNGQNPTHVYDVSGIYTVSLTAANADGSDTLVRTNYITVTSGGGFSGEGFILSRNPDFSTDDRTFHTGETLYMLVWTDQVDFNDIKKAQWELRDPGRKKVKQSLTNQFDNSYTAAFDLSGLPSGASTWTWKGKIEDNNRVKFNPTTSITVLP